MASEARKFLAAVLQEGDVKKFMGYGNLNQLFQFDQAYTPALTFVSAYVKTTGKLPTIELVEQETGTTLGEPGADSAFFYQKVQDRHVERSLKMLGNQMKEVLASDPVAAMKDMSEGLRSLQVDIQGSNLVDFKHALTALMPSLYAKWSGQITAVPFGWQTLDKMTGGLRGGDLVSIVGRPGLGKAQPLSQRILMADGTWRTMGDLKCGDALASIDGKPSKVENIYPQGTLDVYKVTFADGREVRCCADHLWEVYSSKFDGRRVMHTRELMEKLGKVRYQGRLSVVAYGGHAGNVSPEIPPYLIGAMLGDGCVVSRDFRITSADPEILEHLTSLLEDGYEIRGSGIEFRITHGVKGKPNLYKDWFVSRGLWGLKALEKSLPAGFDQWTRQARIELLRGLMDTDGWVYVDQVVFGSSSPKLAKDVQTLCWSLGMTATLNTASNGSWRVSLLKTNGVNPFRLLRKSKAFEAISRQQDQRTVKIVSVVPDGQESCQCIKVSHPRSLYVTENYVVTHNTWLLLYVAMHIWQNLKQPVVFVSMEMNRSLILERLAALYTHIPPDFFKDGASPTLFGTDFKVKLKQDLTALESSDMPPFIVLDSKLTATVDDVVALVHMIQPAAVFIDGAYMLSHPQARNMFDAVAKNTHLLKGDLAERLNLPAICTWQFSRDADKVKKGETPGLQHIGYSDTIGQLSSIVLGLFEEDDKENVELHDRRHIHILKGRSGEAGEFFCRWDFDKVDFSEIDFSQGFEFYDL